MNFILNIILLNLYLKNTLIFFYEVIASTIFLIILKFLENLKQNILLNLDLVLLNIFPYLMVKNKFQLNFYLFIVVDHIFPLLMMKGH